MSSEKGRPVVDAIVQKQQQLRDKSVVEAELAFAIPEERFDRIARLAKMALGAPICMISLLDGEKAWNKACVGLSSARLAQDPDLCAYVVGGDELFHVHDCGQDDRFAKHPWVAGFPNIGFFAGAPFRDHSGATIGSISVMGPGPRELGDKELAALIEAAMMVESEYAAGSMRDKVALLERQAEQGGATATLDALTGLWSREAMLALLRCDLARGERGQPTTLATVGIDGLDFVEAAHGEAAAQALSVGVAQAIGNCVRDFDIVGRAGDGSFLLILSNTDRKQGAVVCERLRKFVMHQSFKSLGAASLRASVSIGAATTSSGALALQPMLEASASCMVKASRIKNKYLSHPDPI